MKKTVFINGKYINPTDGSISILNILLHNEKVIGLGYLPDDKQDDLDVIDISGQFILSNLTDAYVHTGEPGDEMRETIASISEAAVQSGISAIITSPLTHPILDTPETIHFVLQKSQVIQKAHFLPLGTISKLSQGEALSEMGMMKSEGAVGFTDGNALTNPMLMINALKYSGMLGLPLFVRPYTPKLSDGVINEGYYSTILGLKPISRVGETAAIARDIQLLSQYGGTLVFFPVTTHESLALIKDAKDKGLSVYCGTAPQYFWFNDAHIEGYQTEYKIFPPLRTETDIAALIEGVQNNTIDFIASDHTPLTIDDKRHDFDTALPGMSGIDMLLPSILTKLHIEHQIPLPVIAEKLSSGISKIFHLNYNALALNQSPSFTVVNCDLKQTISESHFHSDGKNSPFIGKTLQGFATYTVAKGRVFKTSKA